MDKFSELKAAAMAATPGPWEWFTSNSMARLSSTPSGKDGDVLSAFRAFDGVPCVSVSQRDMAFIAAANPAVVIALLAELEAKDTPKDIRVAEIEKRLKQRAEEAESRIAELEAKLATPVRLPDIEFVKISGIDFPVMRADIVKKEVRRAGFKVEGDE
ncbi:TPA: ead/Ea22-like family protein [Serratia marcescens]